MTRRGTTAPTTSRPDHLVVLIVLSLLALGPGACGGSSGGSSSNNLVYATELFSMQVPVGNNTQLRVLGTNGLIEINGSSTATSVSISGLMKVGSFSLNDAQLHLSDLDVVVTEVGTEVIVETEQPGAGQTGGRNYIVEYAITIPDTMRVNASQANGDVAIDGINSDIDVSQANGSIVVDAILPPNGLIELGVANGDISLTIPTVTSAVLSCVSGTGTVSYFNLNVLNRVQTRNSLAGTLGGGSGHIAISNANGDIVLQGI